MVRARVRTSLLLALGASFAAETAARADEPISFSIAGTVPAGCPPLSRFVDEVTGRTSRAQHRGLGEGRRFRLVIEERASLFRGRLEAMETGGGQAGREVTAHRCNELMSALALSLALALDPDATTAPVSALALPENAPEVRRWRLAAGAEATGAFLPAILVGPSVALESTLGRLSVRLAARYLRLVPRDALTYADVHLAAAALTLCPISRDSPSGIGYAACLAVEGGAVVGRGRNLDNPKTPVFPWLAAGALVRAGWMSAGTLGFEVEAGGVVPLTRPELVTTAPTRSVANAHGVAVQVGAHALLRFR